MTKQELNDSNLRYRKMKVHQAIADLITTPIELLAEFSKENPDTLSLLKSILGHDILMELSKPKPDFNQLLKTLNDKKHYGCWNTLWTCQLVIKFAKNHNITVDEAVKGVRLADK